MKVKHHVNMEASTRILRRTSYALIRERIHYKRRELDNTSRELLHLHLSLASSLRSHDWDMIDNFTTAQAYLILTSATARQKQKFGGLQDTQHATNRIDADKVVVNLTNRVLDPATMAILSKGLNYAQTTSLKSNLKHDTSRQRQTKK
jgi:hypothetical protein